MHRPRALIAASCLVVAAATAPTLAHAQAQGSPSFVGRTWISTDSTAAPNTLRIFLPDGTLVMVSCSETYRLASWRSTGAQVIEWREDTARIEAEVTQPNPNQLRLRLRLRGETKDEHYQLAKVPFVCPDARPSPVAATVSVTGRVFFRERLAPPPSAVVRVELRATSRADAPARTLAMQTIPTNQGPPFAFSLTVPKAAIDPRASLSVFAEIRDGQRLMFTTDTRHSVALDGASNMDVQLRFVASGPGDRAPGIVTPPRTSYRCGNETFKVAFQEGQAYVTLADGSLTTVKRLAGAPPGEPRRFSNGRLTFEQAGATAAASRVSFARGRMAPVPCRQQDG